MFRVTIPEWESGVKGESLGDSCVRLDEKRFNTEGTEERGEHGGGERERKGQNRKRI
jgi:hypothetical protein